MVRIPRVVKPLMCNLYIYIHGGRGINGRRLVSFNLAKLAESYLFLRVFDATSSATHNKFDTIAHRSGGGGAILERLRASALVPCDGGG